MRITPILILILTSCLNNMDDQFIYYEDFHLYINNTKKTTPKIVKNLQLKQPISIKLLDSILILNDYSDSTVISFINLKNSEQIGSIQRGKGPNEVLFISDIKIDKKNNKIFLLDAMNKKVLGFPLSTILKSDQNLSVQDEYGLNSAILKFTPLQDSLFIFTGLTDKRFSIYNKLKKEIITQCGEWPTSHQNIDENKAELLLNNQANIQYNPSTHQLFLIYSKKPILECYHFEPSSETCPRLLWTKTITTKDKPTSIQNQPTTSFINGQIGKDVIYTLYRDHQENEFFILFDFAGNIKRIIQLSEYDLNGSEFFMDIDLNKLFFIGQNKINLEENVYELHLQ